MPKTSKRHVKPTQAEIQAVAAAAAALAAHIRQHFPIKGQGTPPSGGPSGGRDDTTVVELLARRQILNMALMALDAQTEQRAPAEALDWATATERSELHRIRQGYAELSQNYGLDRVDAGELVAAVFPAIEPATVQRLAYGANQLLAAATPPAKIAQPTNQGDKDDDPGDWILSRRKVRGQHLANNKELKSFSNDHPEMVRPRGKYKLEIHAARWMGYWAKQDRKGLKNLDGDLPSIADDPDIQDDALTGAFQRVATLREKKKKQAGKQ